MAAEDAWKTSPSIGTYYLDVEEYRYIRDIYKAQWIYEHYGYDSFIRFVERCPHIYDIIKEYNPCGRGAVAQCEMFCYYYKDGGCKYATE